MINGRILITKEKVARLIQEALQIDVDMKHDGFMYRVDRAISVLEYRIGEHCATWYFGKEDRKLIEDHVISLYKESKAFLEI